VYPPIHMFGVAESCPRHAISQPSGSDSDFRLIDCIPTCDSQTAHFCSPRLRRQSKGESEGCPGLILISRQPPECACPIFAAFEGGHLPSDRSRVSSRFAKRRCFPQLFSPSCSPNLERAISFLKSLHTSATRLAANSLGLKILPLSVAAHRLNLKTFQFAPNSMIAMDRRGRGEPQMTRTTAKPDR
jgi:hypothetical protein